MSAEDDNILENEGTQEAGHSDYRPADAKDAQVKHQLSGSGIRLLVCL